MNSCKWYRWMRKIYFTNLNNAPTDISLNLLKILHELIHELIHEPRYCFLNSCKLFRWLCWIHSRTYSRTSILYFEYFCWMRWWHFEIFKNKKRWRVEGEPPVSGNPIEIYIIENRGVCFHLPPFQIIIIIIIIIIIFFYYYYYY